MADSNDPLVDCPVCHGGTRQVFQYDVTAAYSGMYRISIDPVSRVGTVTDPSGTTSPIVDQCPLCLLGSRIPAALAAAYRLLLDHDVDSAKAAADARHQWDKMGRVE